MKPPRPLFEWLTWLAFLLVAGALVGAMLLDAIERIAAEDYKP